MAEALANVIPLSDERVKLHFIGWDGPRTTGLTSVTYDGNDFDVVYVGNNNSWVEVEASFADFDRQSRVIISAEFPVPTPEIALGYGLLYNWYAATDVRGVAPTGFRVPSNSDYTTLQAELGGSLIAGGAMKSIRTVPDDQPRWDAPNTSASDSSGFNLLPAGSRSFEGAYLNLGSRASLLSSDDTANTTLWGAQSNSAQFAGQAFFPAKDYGRSIRCLSDTEPLTAIVQDADGNDYSWVQIGSQYWLKQSLKTTKYNNGDPIPTGLDNAAWAATTDGAYAFPNGDPNLPI